MEENRTSLVLNEATRDVQDIFLHALDAARVNAAMERRIAFREGSLVVEGRTYAFDCYQRILLVAIGKAGVALASSFSQLLGDDAQRLEGVVVGPGDEELPPSLKLFRGGHPSPNQVSLEAAAEILRLLDSTTEGDLVVFLISGGGSSMVEQMLHNEIILSDIAAMHKALVESGAPIASINAVRKHLSAVKGGRLAMAAAPAEQLTIFVSDVPAGELDALASGPTVPDRSTVAEVHKILQQYGLQKRFPESINRLLAEKQETPKPGDPAFALSHWVVLLDSNSLEEAATVRASELGWNVTIDNTCDDWSADEAAIYLLKRLDELRTKEERICLISAGEVTVQVSPNASGRGGRNQQFALICAKEIAGRDLLVLSAGSDGVDGTSPAAGAVVDGTTVERAAAAGYPVEKALADFDSHRLVALLGDAIMTGATGNNLRDLRILLAP